MRMFRSMFLRVAAFLGIVAACSCTKEEIKTEYSRQEKNIESFINSTLTSIDTAYVVQNKGVSRVVVAPGIEGDSLKLGGKCHISAEARSISQSPPNIPSRSCRVWEFTPI